MGVFMAQGEGAAGTPCPSSGPFQVHADCLLCGTPSRVLLGALVSAS